MPLVRIDMIRGKSPEYKKAVFEAVHTGLIEALEIEDWDRFQRIVEIDKEDFEVPEGNTENFMIIELTIYPGRNKEQKKQAIEAITKNIIDKTGIDGSDVFIIFLDPPYENWGRDGKQKEMPDGDSTTHT